MNTLESEVLTAWANGCPGVPPRLSRRAWAVLKEHDHANPFALGEALGGSGRVSLWLRKYRQMGLVGLLDAPRRGRPPTTLNRAIKVMEQTASHDGQVGLAALHRSEREAIWHAARRSGLGNLERRRHADVHVIAPRNMPNLVGVFASSGLLVIATIDNAESIFESPSGKWLNVPNTNLADRLQRREPDLIAALTVLAAMSRTTQSSHRTVKSRKSSRLETERIERRFALCLADNAALAPHGMHVSVQCNFEDVAQSIRMFELFRELELWPFNSRYQSGLLGSLHVSGCRGDVRSQAVVTLLRSAYSQPDVEQLQSALSKAQHDVFAWARVTDDTDQDSDGSSHYG